MPGKSSAEKNASDAPGITHLDMDVFTFLESLAEGVVVVDEKGKIVTTNERLCQMLGYTRAEILDKYLDMLLPERLVDKHQGHFSRFFRAPNIRPMGQGLELVAQRKDGKELPVEISLSHIQTGNGQLAFAFVTDITVRKNIENELRERNRELDTFAMTLAHDISSTLTGVVGFSEMLLDPTLSLSEEERQFFLQQIASGGQALNNVVKELLFFARMRKNDVVLSPVDMSEVVSAVLERQSYFIGEYGAVINVPASFHDASGYGPWIEEVWYNFISNAIKYGGSPPVVTLGSEDAGGDYIKFFVRDNGDGIDPAFKEAVFHEDHEDRFSIVKGHGLGLPIVYSIMKKLDGYVSVESEPGQGSLFCFYLKKV